MLNTNRFIVESIRFLIWWPLPSVNGNI